MHSALVPAEAQLAFNAMQLAAAAAAGGRQDAPAWALLGVQMGRGRQLGNSSWCSGDNPRLMRCLLACLVNMSASVPVTPVLLQLLRVLCQRALLRQLQLPQLLQQQAERGGAAGSSGGHPRAQPQRVQAQDTGVLQAWRGVVCRARSGMCLLG
jgi:hypothetical protein